MLIRHIVLSSRINQRRHRPSREDKNTAGGTYADGVIIYPWRVHHGNIIRDSPFFWPSSYLVDLFACFLAFAIFRVVQKRRSTTNWRLIGKISQRSAKGQRDWRGSIIIAGWFHFLWRIDRRSIVSATRRRVDVTKHPFTEVEQSVVISTCLEKKKKNSVIIGIVQKLKIFLKVLIICSKMCPCEAGHR